MTDRRLPRVALGVGLCLGLYALVAMPLRKPGLAGVNYEVYYYAAEAVLSGGDLYATTPPGHPAYRYLYPPIVVVAFLPYALLPGPGAGLAVHTGLQVASGLALGGLAVRTVERHRGRLPALDRALVVGYATASIHLAPSLFFGNVNATLALLVAAGLVALERRGTESGLLLALPALVKAFPAAFGLVLPRRRAWRAVGAAVATGGGALLASLAAFGVGTHRRYVTVALLGRLDAVGTAGGMPPGAQVFSLRRPLSVAVPAAPSWAISVGALALVVPVVGYCYRGATLPGDAGRTEADRRGDPARDHWLVAYVTVAAVLVALPSYFVYYAFALGPALILLYLLRGRPRRLFAAGVLVANVAYAGPKVATALSRLPLPDGVVGPAATAASAVFGVATPPLVGTLLCLLACVLAVRGDGGAAADQATS